MQRTTGNTTAANAWSGERAARRAELPWLTLIKPRISLFVFFAAFTGGLLGGGPGTPLSVAFLAALAIGAVAGASCVFNQILERDTDALMRRTAQRPLITGRVDVRDATLFAASLTILGVGILAYAFNLLSALLALGTLVGYVLVYTPLKRTSAHNTIVGAIPGAMPPLLGVCALTGTVTSWGWLLFGVFFLWQFPHFMAIAWLYREDYARAGLRMLPALPGSQGVAGRQALLYSLVLVPLSILPGARGDAGPVYTVGVLLLGLAYAVASARFARRESNGTARALLVVSLFYLPLFLSATLLDPIVSLALRGT